MAWCAFILTGLVNEVFLLCIYVAACMHLWAMAYKPLICHCNTDLQSGLTCASIQCVHCAADAACLSIDQGKN